MIADGVCRSFFLPLIVAAFSLPAVKVIGAPIDETNTFLSSTEKPDCKRENIDIYDQKQNGTENLRINLSGVVVVVAPAETVLQATQLAHLENNLDQQVMTETSGLKPKPRPPTPSDNKSATVEVHNQQTLHQPKEVKENRLRLLNLLRMFKGMKQEMGNTSQNFKQ